ncbi:MAG: hypothetical protein E7102_11485 [Prevotella ruminicola]|uniref:Uncharacterized protein n=1 Tax=Xylanibacter ruminicola TaxID=839 RepID=A0A928GJJ5_XYLRU|nr:hypothetical protein [Xylanibacter ruminicola]
MSSREKVRSKLSCAYTQTIVRLYPNNHSLILKLKRFSKRGTMYTRLIISFVTNRAIAFELWMKSPMPMVTFTKTFDVTRLCKVSRRRGMRSASGRLLPDGRLARCPVPGRTTKNNQYIKINEDVSFLTHPLTSLKKVVLITKYVRAVLQAQTSYRLS